MNRVDGVKSSGLAPPFMNERPEKGEERDRYYGLLRAVVRTSADAVVHCDEACV